MFASTLRAYKASLNCRRDGAFAFSFKVGPGQVCIYSWELKIESFDHDTSRPLSWPHLTSLTGHGAGHFILFVFIFFLSRSSDRNTHRTLYTRLGIFPRKTVGNLDPCHCRRRSRG